MGSNGNLGGFFGISAIFERFFGILLNLLPFLKDSWGSSGILRGFFGISANFEGFFGILGDVLAFFKDFSGILGRGEDSSEFPAILRSWWDRFGDYFD